MKLCLPDAILRLFRVRRFRWRKVAVGDRIHAVRLSPINRHPLSLVPAAAAARAFIEGTVPPPYRYIEPKLYGAPPIIVAQHAVPFDRDEAVQAPAEAIAIFEDVSVMASGILVTRSGEVVSESLANTEFVLRFGNFVREKIGDPFHIEIRFKSLQKRYRGGPFVLLRQSYDGNYGHWLIDCLPRIAFVSRHVDLKQARIIVSTGSAAMRAVYADSLAAFGVPAGNIVYMDYESAHVDHLIYPLPISIHPWVKSPRIVEILEQLAASIGRDADSQRSPRLLYVSRNKYGKRCLLNEDAILEICLRHGFEVVYPETMSFKEQVIAFRRADVIIGNCGASLTNAVFAPRGCTLFALCSQQMSGGFFWDLMAVKGGRYLALHGEVVGGLADEDWQTNMERDFEIDPRRFVELLSEILAPRSTIA